MPSERLDEKVIFNTLRKIEFSAPIPNEQVGTMIGPHKLIEEIGEGGMGNVFMALQKTPVRQKVALKLIKPGMDSKQVVSRSPGVWGRHRAKLGTPLEGVPGFPLKGNCLYFPQSAPFPVQA